jgi:hypothetical protein
MIFPWHIMKMRPILFALLAINSYYAFGQGLPTLPNTNPETNILLSREPFIVEIKQPLLFIGSLETSYNALIMDEENLRILRAFPDSTALDYFGEKGKDGVVIAELKANIALFRIEETLDHFKVPDINRNLKILIDKRLVHRDLFLADIKRIEKIELFEVTQQDILLSPFYNTWTLGEKYLNIVTKEE